MPQQIKTQSDTLITKLIQLLRRAVQHQPGIEEAPVAILWADPKEEWRDLIPLLQSAGEQIFTLGKYDPAMLTGPVIWIKCALAGVLDEVQRNDEPTPIVYLPGVSRQTLRAGEECPRELQPLVELQFRGVVFCQQNGRDWTIEAMLKSDTGLGLDVARDAATRESMRASLRVLATIPVKQLKGKRLEAVDFDTLMVDDPQRDLLEWMTNPEAQKTRLHEEGKWYSFRNQCQNLFGFDPETDGDLVAGEKLGIHETGAWMSLWKRFCDSPGVYPNISDLLRRAKPVTLPFDKEPWPDENEEAESTLRAALCEIGTMDATSARARVCELEKEHRIRRGWVWAKLEQCPLATALEHISRLAEVSNTSLGGDSLEAMAELYAKGAYLADDAVLEALACVKKKENVDAVTHALRAIYQPWLEDAAIRFQKIVKQYPLPLPKDQPVISAEKNECILFADGLRFDIAQRLMNQLKENGLQVNSTRRWSAMPSVTATAKPAVSPIVSQLHGVGLPDDFTPHIEKTGQPLSVARFRKLLSNAGYQYLDKNETGNIGETEARAWTESGEIDRRGHSLQENLASQIGNELDRLTDRVVELLDAGWKSIRIVTDHGWLLMPGGLKKYDLPKYLTGCKWSRCATIKGQSKVSVPSVQWSWNPNEYFAVAPGACCFVAGNAYAHGGLSLQECLITDIHVQSSVDTGKIPVSITNLQWQGLRCRVYVEPHDSSLRVDIRTKAASANTSLVVSQLPKEIDANGRTSLVVEDDDLIGTMAVIVVLDSTGHPIAKHPVTIGGDD